MPPSIIVRALAPLGLLGALACNVSAPPRPSPASGPGSGAGMRGTLAKSASASPATPRTSPPPLPAAAAPQELPCWQADELAADARPERSYHVRFADGQRLPAVGASFVCRGIEPDPFPPCRVVAVHPEGYVEAACPGAR